MTTEEMLEQIGKLNINKLLGLDGICPRVLKEFTCETAELLAIEGNLSLQKPSLPED